MKTIEQYNQTSGEGRQESFQSLDKGERAKSIEIDQEWARRINSWVDRVRKHGDTIVPVEELIPGIKDSELVKDWEGNEPGLGGGASGGENFSRVIITGLGAERTEGSDSPWTDIITRKPLQGEVVVELGVGRSFGPDLGLASTLGAQGYVGVDIRDCDGIESAPPEQKNSPEHWGEVYAEASKGLSETLDLQLEPISAAFVKQGMLQFLRRLPDRSVSIFISLVDDLVIDPEQIREIWEEVQRVLSDRGLCVVSMSGLDPSKRPVAPHEATGIEIVTPANGIRYGSRRGTSGIYRRKLSSSEKPSE